jgi:3-oxoacyl-[acyl-carrier protein] reductase
MELNGAAAIVTGSGRGIGRAVALALAGAGSHVVITARSGNELAEVKAAVEVAARTTGSGARCIAVRGDIAEEQTVASLVAAAIENFGGVDVLVNNAGMLVHTRLPDVTAAEWDATMAVNLRAAFLLSQRVLPLMKERRRGYIINVSSPAARGVGSALTTYGISKAGLIGLSQALFDEARGAGIKVSTLYPGYVDTEMIRHREDLAAHRDLWAQPEDMAHCVLFLLSLSDRVIVKDLAASAFRTE